MATKNSVAMLTDSSVEEYDFMWEIKNFSRHMNKIESAVFTPLSNMKAQFSVSIRYLEISLTRVYSLQCQVMLEKLKDEGDVNNLRVEFDLKFTSVDGSVLKTISKSYSEVFCNGALTMGTIYTDCFNYCDVKNRWKIFNVEKKPSDDTVIVKIHFTFFGHKVITKSIVPSLMKSPHQNLFDLSNDLKNLYNQKTVTDITIRIDGTVIHAHQNILIARSPVFARMLESFYLESDSKCITITDVDFKVFDGFLKYLYSGVVEDKTFSNAYSLYSVADKYAVCSLQEECADILASHFTPENVCCALELSYLHSDLSLRENAIYFISTYFHKIKSKPEWNEIIRKYPELSSEVLGFIASCF